METDKFTLIVPAAADNGSEQRRLPKIFMNDEEGIMMCVRAILGLNLADFTDIYFTILKKHIEQFDIDTLLSLQLRRLGIKNAKILILDNPTDSQAETIAITILHEDITGPVFIKDADSSFSAFIYPENSVAVFPLEELSLVDPRNKSYVAVDDMQHITNIIEKRIIGNLFSAGGYCFENASEFLGIYRESRRFGKPYISHLVYALLLANRTFRPIRVYDYLDFNIV